MGTYPPSFFFLFLNSSDEEGRGRWRGRVILPSPYPLPPPSLPHCRCIVDAAAVSQRRMFLETQRSTSSAFFIITYFPSLPPLCSPLTTPFRHAHTQPAESTATSPPLTHTLGRRLNSWRGLNSGSRTGFVYTPSSSGYYSFIILLL